MNPRAGSCFVRRVSEHDFAELDRMYLAHEGNTVPTGYFEEFQRTIRDPSVEYFVAEIDGRLVGGGGISNYIPRVEATLTFGIVDPVECRKGFGTSIILSRLLYVDPGSEGCQIVLQATEWSCQFFSRLGFSWYDPEEDESGSRFFTGTHMVYPGDERVFRHILEVGGVTLGFQPDRNSRAGQPSDPGDDGGRFPPTST